VDRMCSSIREFGFKIFGSERRHCEFSLRSDCGRHMDCSGAPEKQANSAVNWERRRPGDGIETDRQTASGCVRC
jgi:hypothetical protein